MHNFWENILFSNENYNGNPMCVHQKLHRKSAMTTAHFQHWLSLFRITVDELFAGVKSEEIKERAYNIASALIDKTLY